jgi:hypothetical protein
MINNNQNYLQKQDKVPYHQIDKNKEPKNKMIIRLHFII